MPTSAESGLAHLRYGVQRQVVFLSFGIGDRDHAASPLHQSQRNERGQCVEHQDGEPGGLLLGHAAPPC